MVTFFICMAGLSIGKKFGTKLSGKASILGGVILIGIGSGDFYSRAVFEAGNYEDTLNHGSRQSPRAGF